MISVLQDAEIAQHVTELAANPVIIEMESEIPADVDINTWEFMVHARAEAENRGVFSNIIGGVALAIKQIRQSR